MLVIMITTGLAGSFLYYCLLLGLATKDLQKTRLYWARCVGANAFLLAVSATMVASYFGAELSYFLTVSLWFVFALVLHSGYLVVTKIAEKESADENDTKSEE